MKVVNIIKKCRILLIRVEATKGLMRQKVDDIRTIPLSRLLWIFWKFDKLLKCGSIKKIFKILNLAISITTNE